ncbi:MAG: DUF2974 domain-containing protein [Candidatus Saccharibacteria bacterium]|nr:DUF2974 domain-containing protein [Candidatus Saccharibacteria bacterium]
MTKLSGNVVDYIRNHGDQDFWRRDFNDVDSLVLATLCYLDWDQTPFAKIANFNCTIAELHQLAHAHKLSWLMWNSDRGAELLRALAASKRYQNVLIHHYRREVEPDQQKQFAAITYTLDTDSGYIDYVAFQGTDDSLNGWKEDLNMTFVRHLPAQRAAADYLRYIATLSDNKLIVGGHSKGGNLAMYASLKASMDVKHRIVNIYDHDGPGFLPNTFTNIDRLGVRGKIRKTVPQMAFFGMLLDDQFDTKSTVVLSDGKSLFQHDTLTWQIDGTEFATCDQPSKLSKYYVRTIRRWLTKLDATERQAFVDNLYDILASTNQVTDQGIKEYIFANMPVIIKQIHASDPEVRNVITKTLKLLASSSVSEARATISGRLRRLFNKK